MNTSGHRLYRWAVAAALLLCCAAPASAQYKPRTLNDPATGESYHIEAGAGYWFPSADIIVSSEQLGIPGSQINAKRDLGLTNQRFPILDLVLRPFRSHKFRFQYIPVTFTQTATLNQDIVFNGIRYRLGLPVNSTLDWKTYEFGYEYDFVVKNWGFVGFNLQAKYTDVEVKLASLIATEFAHARGPIPAIGGTKQAVWLSGLVPFAQAAEILSQVGQVAMSDSSVWRRTDAWGTRCQTVEATQQVLASAPPTRSEVMRGEVRQRTDMGVAMDGAMVPIRTEGWKELKVGCVFEIDVRPTPDKTSPELLDLAHAVRNSYVAHLGGPEAFGQQVWTEARRRRFTQAHDTIVVGDGAVWVWNLAREHFYDSRQVVDWYHATQHLASAAHALHGDGTSVAQQWYKQHETMLFQGHADRLGEQLCEAAAVQPAAAEVLQREAGYFADNQRRMQYLELREDGFPIGSGMVESGCKQFRQRFSGPGMQWSRPGIERLLPIRAAILSQRFDQLWKSAYASPPT